MAYLHHSKYCPPVPRLERLKHRVLRASRGGQPQQGGGLAQLQDEQGSDASLSREVAAFLCRRFLFSYLSSAENNAFVTSNKTSQLLIGADSTP